MSVKTPDLRLTPYTPQHFLALIDGYEQFSDDFGLPAAAGLREFLGAADVSPAWLERLRSSDQARRTRSDPS